MAQPSSGPRRVVKVGTSLLRGTAARPTAAVIADLAASINRACRRGESIALVTSGAVGLGCARLALAQRPKAVAALQAAAAVGQEDFLFPRSLPQSLSHFRRDDFILGRRHDQDFFFLELVGKSDRVIGGDEFGRLGLVVSQTLPNQTEYGGFGVVIKTIDESTPTQKHTAP